MGGSLATTTLLGKLVDAIPGLAEDLVMEHSEFPVERVALTFSILVALPLGCPSHCVCTHGKVLLSLSALQKQFSHLQKMLHTGQFEKGQFLDCGLGLFVVVLFCFFETGSHYIILPGLELTVFPQYSE